MTQQEQELIDGLVDRIRNTPAQDKDHEAEQRLQQGLAGAPDALYVLAQTVLVQQYGLQQAQQRMQQMEAEMNVLRQKSQDAPQQGGSFLGKIFGGGSSSSQQPGQGQPAAGQGYGSAAVPYQPVNNPGYAPQPGYPPQQAGYPQGGYPPQQGYPPAYGQPYGYGGGGGGGMFGGGSFLSGALQTAAGVAAGEMVFRGMEGMFSGFENHHSGGGYEGGPHEVVENNYYGDRPEHHDAAANDDGSFYNPSHDASRDAGGGDKSAFADTDDRSEPDDFAREDSFGDSSNDDFGSSDDFGSGDSGSDDN